MDAHNNSTMYAHILFLCMHLISVCSQFHSLILSHVSPLKPSEQAHVSLDTQAPLSHGGSHTTVLSKTCFFKIEHNFSEYVN